MQGKDDFREIEPPNYQLSFIFSDSEDGKRMYRMQLSINAEGPFCAVGVYAIFPHGIPVQDFAMGGVGQPWEPAKIDGCLPVLLGSDSEGRFGHRCPVCEKYFRNGCHPRHWKIKCPYCRHQSDAVHFMTEAQCRYVRAFAERVHSGFDIDIPEGQECTLSIDIGKMVDEVVESHESSFYFTSTSQQTIFSCEKCGEFNDIMGVFGYCASCGYRNNRRHFREELRKIRDRLNAASDSPEACLRNGVAHFDATTSNFLRELSMQIPMKNARRKATSSIKINNLMSSKISNLRHGLEIDILRGIDDLDFANRMMARRHVHEHLSGVVDQEYLERTGDSTVQEGQLLREDRAEVNRFFTQLERMVDNINSDFHEILPVDPLALELTDRRNRG